MAVKEKPATKTIATNREARHEYFVMEALETGIELKGTEVKSLRAGGVNLKDSWVDIDGGELIVKGMHITPYDHGKHLQRRPPPGSDGSWPTKARSAVWASSASCRATPWCPSRSTSSTGGSRWSWGCAKAKSSTTSGPTRPSGTPSVPSTGP